MSIKLDELQQLLNETQTPSELSSKIISLAEALEEEKKADREAVKTKNKNQFVVMLKGAPKDSEIVAHVFQLPAEAEPLTLIDKVKAAAVFHNIAQSKKKNMVHNIDDAPHIKRKFSKDAEYMLKTKDWVQTVLVTSENEVIAPPIQPD